jgi:hypothetical protein
MSGPTCSRAARPCSGCSSRSTSACSRTAGCSPGRLLDPRPSSSSRSSRRTSARRRSCAGSTRTSPAADGGLPELFSPQPAEVALPSDELSRALIAFWRHRDADTGATWSFAEERFEGELMGDLYQELDPVVKDRFALCQTPDFVRAFILDRTLTPAIETFGADEVRLLDPACGSGHFLIDGLKRLVARPPRSTRTGSARRSSEHALDRVVGVDLNDYACALARTRLIMTAAELAGVTKLADAARFHPHVYWADGLEQVEKEEQKPRLAVRPVRRRSRRSRARRSRARMCARRCGRSSRRSSTRWWRTRRTSRRRTRPARYHREKVGKNSATCRPTANTRSARPSRSAAFSSREKGGFVGIITSNNFMKREFGKPLIEKVLAGLDLTLVVDTSQAYIPFHGTPTVAALCP